MSSENFRPICVITFPDGTSDELVSFIQQCTQTIPHTDKAGAELTYKLSNAERRKTFDEFDNGSPRPQAVFTGVGLKCLKYSNLDKVSLFVGCSDERLLEVADYVDMKKKCLDNTLQVFKVENLDLFKHSDNLAEFFTEAERQWLVRHEIESIKVSANDFILPGAPKVKFLMGTSLIKQCLHHGLIGQIFPLHDESLPILEDAWYRRLSPFQSQPLEAVKDYFGETVGMYFAFLDYYTRSLTLPAAVGVVFYWYEFHKTSISSLIILAVFNLIWSTAFMESWKRRSNGLAYSWGTSDFKTIEEARPEFYGELGRNPVTDKVEPTYPKWKRRIRFYLISLPIVLVCLLVSFVAMLAYIEFENNTIAWYNSLQEVGYLQEAYSYLPTVLYSLAIIVMNQLYRPLAIKLNEWENHRLQSTFDNHLTVKLVLFWFINTFMLMFYTAFYQQDLLALRKTVLTELLVTQAVDQLQETLIPYIMYKWRKRGMLSDEPGEHLSALHRSTKEGIKDTYEGTFDDFLELFIQYGYVTLFSCVSPLAAVLSLINNYIELRSDAIKLCKIHQRPFSKPAAGIGAWQSVFEVMGYIAIITNSALIGLCAYQGNLLPNTNNLHLLLLVVALEHVLIVVRAMIAYIIPDSPKSVLIASARDAYQLKTKFLALKVEAQVKRLCSRWPQV